MNHSADQSCLKESQRHAQETVSKSASSHSTLPEAAQLQKAHSSLLDSLPEHGYGVEKTTRHMLEDLTPALNGQSLSSRYYGFVTGGITPAARVAESIVSTYDQNVCVHLPEQTVATTVEDRALNLLLELLYFVPTEWPSRTFTTGATASNIVGLACGREYIINEAIRKRNTTGVNIETVGENGLLAACRAADITDVQILTTMPHSSLKKAASVVGFGRTCFHEVGKAEDPLEFDLTLLEERLKKPHIAAIVVISCSEVNTGFFATHGYDQTLVRSHFVLIQAWVGVGLTLLAFGLFARVLRNSPDYRYVYSGTVGLELADSIAGDGHKLINVPYDCGFYFSRHQDMAHQVFQNPNAAYLSSGKPNPDNIQSPLNIGLENSRRFRALPVYANLMAYGRTGYVDMLHRQVLFARGVAGYFLRHEAFDLLPTDLQTETMIAERIYIIVLFRAKDDTLNSELVKRLNASSQMYLSGTIWQGRPACRIAAANWQIGYNDDDRAVRNVVEEVLHEWRHEHS
ncbi:MAG: hypothetical protein Q9174_001541 [Haloplaca sp. 1 TL-2023]